MDSEMLYDIENKIFASVTHVSLVKFSNCEIISNITRLLIHHPIIFSET